MEEQAKGRVLLAFLKRLSRWLWGAVSFIF
jgi:hypothetical protein